LGRQIESSNTDILEGERKYMQIRESIRTANSKAVISRARYRRERIYENYDLFMTLRAGTGKRERSQVSFKAPAQECSL
jgi:hypothetical protein